MSLDICDAVRSSCSVNLSTERNKSTTVALYLLFKGILSQPDCKLLQWSIKILSPQLNVPNSRVIVDVTVYPFRDPMSHGPLESIVEKE